MANKDERGDNACVTVYWNLENLRYSSSNTEEIETPYFTAESLQNSEWCLMLCTKDLYTHNTIGFSLMRSTENVVPDINIDFEFVFLSEDGSVFKIDKREGITFSQTLCDFYSTFALPKEIEIAATDEFLAPLDVLRIRFRIWMHDETTLKSIQIFARTVIEVEYASLILEVKNFSDCPNTAIEHKSFIANTSIFFILSPDTNEKDENVDMGISLGEGDGLFLFCMSYLFDKYGNTLNCGMMKYSSAELLDGVSYELPLTVRNLFENKDFYLKNDVLSLKCECIITKGTPFTTIERYESRDVSPTLLKASSSQSVLASESTEKKANGLREDIVSLYREGILCDTELRAENKTFPAHILVLSARSPVFRVMFTEDFKEKAKGCVDIADLDSDTVHKMLRE
ncbi:TD and POZ domain-containing protein 3 [Nephila pilipes]|uniref:TD and POZ domain-containing protein 3 n=1 Tax=Nephila pilipes TaxID=299642 RepID=A0A8X6MC38_NEPPI|nr:TD and POZ domain-containing protein 3 [Nephila pilipes]